MVIQIFGVMLSVDIRITTEQNWRFSIMLNRAQLEEALSISYPLEVTQETQKKRMTNIESIINLVKTAKNNNQLVYEQKEERIELYTTSAGEKITIQYPGKETVNSQPAKIRPYDFRPRIILPNGDIVRDLVFADMWSIFETVDKDYHLLTKSLAALFFRMGRMIDYDLVTEDYHYEVIDIVSNSVLLSGTKTLSWYKFSLASDIIDELNHDVFSIPIDNNQVISFEAFLYFFSLILENEDIKYYYKKNNLSSGRIPTSDSMLMLASHFSGATSLSALLQRFVSGFGVGKCLTSEIGPATSNIIKIVDLKQEIVDYLSLNNIQYKENATIYVSGKTISVLVKVKSHNIAILKKPDSNKEAALSSKNWIVFDIETTTLDNRRYQALLAYFGYISP